MKADGGVGPPFAMAYAVIRMHCLPCHTTGGGATMGMLNMSTEPMAYTNLVGVAAMSMQCMGKGTRVVAGDSATSILYTKITTPTCGLKMPRTGMLTAAQIATIKTWIDGGAKM